MAKSYDIDNIMALPSDKEFALTLHGKLGEMVARQEWLKTDGEFNFYEAYTCNRGVNFDGFDGWFMNGAATPLKDGYGALVAVGAHRRAKLLKFAMGIFPDGEPPEDESYMEIVENLTPEQKAALDNPFSHFTALDYDDTPEDLCRLLRAYVQQHIQEFR
jgi:hypothetical protein